MQFPLLRAPHPCISISRISTYLISSWCDDNNAYPTGLLGISWAGVVWKCYGLCYGSAICTMLVQIVILLQFPQTPAFCFQQITFLPPQTTAEKTAGLWKLHSTNLCYLQTHQPSPTVVLALFWAETGSIITAFAPSWLHSKSSSRAGAVLLFFGFL